MGADVLGLPDLSQLERIETSGEGLLAMRGDRLITAMPRAPKGPGADIVIRSFAGKGLRRLGFLRGGAQRIQVDASGDGYLISYPGERQVFASTLKEGAAGERQVLSTRAPVSSFWLAKIGERIALLDDEGGLYVAALSESREPQQLAGASARPGETVNDVAFDSIGHWLVAAVERQGLRMWDLTGPPDAEPMVLGRGARTTATTGVVFEPTGRWLTAEDLNGVTFWPATWRWPSVLRVAADQPRDVAFDPNGKWIAAASRRGGVEVWPSTVNGFPRRRLGLVAGMHASTLAVSPDGQFLATGTRSGKRAGPAGCRDRLQRVGRVSRARLLGGLRCHRKTDRCEWACGWSAKRGHSRL